MKRLAAAVALAVGLALAAVTVAGAGSDAPVTVFAAASLKNGLDQAIVTWSDRTGGKAVVSYAGTAALARQIEQGAPADLFISADLDWMAYLAERGLIDRASETRLLGNSLVLIAPAASSPAVTITPGADLAALLGGGRLAMADVEAVPAGRYSKAALQHLGLWDGIAGRLAQAENVRAALALVATGEAPLGIVYRTDAAAEPRVRVAATFPADSHQPIVYPAARVAASANAAAPALLEFLGTPEALAIFERAGFVAPPPP